ncbi:MAG: Proline-rich protein [Labilithrix sp.]|nr:Proline-rich protein [Labilithrix sp.]
MPPGRGSSGLSVERPAITVRGMKTRLFLASALVLSLAASACGGEKKPAESPESNAGITETSAKEDMPPPPAKEGDAPAAAPAETKAEAPGAAGGVIKLAAMKVSPVKKGKDKAVELKEDGTVTIDGKPAAKIKGDQVDSSGGTSMLTVGVDGSLVGNGVKPGYKFEGDELVHENGMKLTVGDDGTINSTRDGKSEPIAKAEGGAATAKRAALIATVLWMTVPTSAPAPAAAKAPAKPAKK